MSNLPELEVTIKFKYTPDADNYDHLDGEVTIEGVIETDVVAFKDDPYVLSEYIDNDAEITIVEVK